MVGMEGTPPRGEDVALFIDWENFKISLAAGSRNPNLSALKEEVSNLGRVVVAKAYADWVTRSPELKGASQFIIDPPALYATGIEPVYVPTRLPGGHSYSSQYTRMVRVKNSVDVKMTADCIECAHSYPNISTFVLVSGDSDFIHVVNALRTMGKRVYIIGVSWATSRRLADQVDGLILYDTDVDPLTPVEPAPAPVHVPVQAPAPAQAPVTNGRGTAAAAAGGEITRRELPEVIRAIEEIVRAERQAGRTPLLTSIKQRLTRRFPNFDEKKVGYSGFKKLVLRAAQEGNIKLVTAGLVDWVFMADEPSPVEAAAEAAGQAEEADAQTREQAAEADLEAEGEIVLQLKEETEPVSAAATRAAPRPEPSEQPVPAARLPDPEIASAGLALPKGPDDGLDAGRVADLIVMADTLEQRDGISHVAFNFLVSEVCQALVEGLKVEHPEIVQRWGQSHSQTYVTKLLRSLSNAEMFKHGWHTIRDETTRKSTRRRTLNLNRQHSLVQKVLEARWGLAPAPAEAPHGAPHEAPPSVAREPMPSLEAFPEDEVEAVNPRPDQALELAHTPD
jgi:uncharacterized LabA/DUF88 family protein